jgi:peptidoglycan/LPS O-acetylase OafA/YrhL
MDDRHQRVSALRACGRLERSLLVRSGALTMPNDGTNPARTLRGYIPEIDGLRGLAISAVLLHRFWPDSGLLHRYAKLGELGWVGVDLFFVVSGFLIAGILLDTRGEPGHFRNFYGRRILRIFPLYYAFVGAVFIVFPLLQGGSFFDTAFIRQSGSPLWYLFYLGNVPEALRGQEPPYFIAQVWSLAIEEQFYVLFPLLAFKLTRRHLTWVLTAALAAAPLFRFATAVLMPANERMQYLATPSRVDVLSVGCLLALGLRSRGLQQRKNLPGLATWAVAGCLVLFVLTFALGGLARTSFFGRTLGYSVVALVFGAIVLWTVLHRGTRATAILRLRPLRYLGKICYGLYLLHRPAGFLVETLVERAEPSFRSHTLAMLAMKFGASVVLASASWYAFERPILKLKARFSSSSHPAGTTTSATPATETPLPEGATPLTVSPVDRV